MKILPILLAIYSSTSAQGTWTQKTDFGGTERHASVSFSIGNKGYIGTGGDFLPRKDFWLYDPQMDFWTQKADFGGIARYEAVGFSIGAKGYIGTGQDGTNIYLDFWEYDTLINTWTQKSDFAGGIRVGACGFSIGPKGYLGTGADYSTNHDDFWEYDPIADTWTQKLNFAGGGRYVATGFNIGTKGYMGTGTNFPSVYNDFWEYDPTLNTWTQKADFGGSARGAASGFSIYNKGYMGIGSTYQIDFWEYDPQSNLWTQVANFPGNGRLRASSFSIGNKGYIGVGYTQNGSPLVEDFWEYCPDSVCNNLPIALFSSSTSVCPGTCINFTNQSTNATTFEWFFSGAIPNSSMDMNPQNICYFTPGVYDVTLIATNPNGSDTLTLVNYTTVFPFPLPQGIQQSGDTLLANQGANTYQWYFNGSIITGATNYFYVALSSGDYNVIATDVNACEVEAVLFNVVASVQSSENDYLPMAEPDPTADKIKVLITGKVAIFDSIGNLLIKNEISNTHKEIDISFLRSGMYFLEIETEGKVIQKKMIKL